MEMMRVRVPKPKTATAPPLEREQAIPAHNVRQEQNFPDSWEAQAVRMNDLQKRERELEILKETESVRVALQIKKAQEVEMDKLKIQEAQRKEEEKVEATRKKEELEKEKRTKRLQRYAAAQANLHSLIFQFYQFLVVGNKIKLFECCRALKGLVGPAFESGLRTIPEEYTKTLKRNPRAKLNSTLAEVETKVKISIGMNLKQAFRKGLAEACKSGTVKFIKLNVKAKMIDDAVALLVEENTELVRQIIFDTVTLLKGEEDQLNEIETLEVAESTEHSPLSPSPPPPPPPTSPTRIPNDGTAPDVAIVMERNVVSRPAPTEAMTGRPRGEKSMKKTVQMICVAVIICALVIGALGLPAIPSSP